MDNSDNNYLANLTINANLNYKPPPSLKDKTLNEMVIQAVSEFYIIIDEILNIRNVQDIFLVITKDNRLFYFGIYIILLCIFLYIIIQ